MATSLITVLNRVITGLRETSLPAATITSTYGLLILELFNQVREEVEDACNWRALWQTYTVTIPANSYFAVIPGTNERSRVVRVPIKGGGQNIGTSYAPSIATSDAIVPLVFDITSPTTTGKYPLVETPLAQLLYSVTSTNGQTTQQPTSFSIGMGDPDNAQAGTGNAVIYVYPPPSTNRSIQVTMVTPELTYAATDFARNIYIPTLPIVQGLQWSAREERGEELGQNSMYSEERYRNILDSAVSREMAEQGDSLDLALI